eukprot:RCo045419
MAITEAIEVPEVPQLETIKKAIPDEYFRSNALLSMLYAVRSAMLVAGLACSMWWVHHTAVPMVRAAAGPAVAYALLAAAFLAYWAVQGIVFWGIFTLGHDCGHGSFSRYRSLNWVMGLLLHTFLSVPYDPWRMSHRHHHKNTGNLDHDEIFYPMRTDEDCWRTRWMCYSLGGAWFCYLLVGFPPRQVSHVRLDEPMWGKERYTVAVSLAMLGAFYLGMLGLVVMWCGVAAWLLYYFAPLYVFGSMLVITTFLHHNADDTVWYAGNNWNYVRGNLNSVDRDYGWLVNCLSHNIGTHQIHHLFPIIPHYNLKPATRAFRAAFPALAKDRSAYSILPELWSSLATYTRLGATRNPSATVFSYAAVKAALREKKAL